MENIFISYRREASDVTGRIADVLKSKFGGDVLFKDVDSIPLGTDFRRVIADAVGASATTGSTLGRNPAVVGSTNRMTLSISRFGQHSSATFLSFRCSSNSPI